jgi:hypothetical protein
VFQLYFFPVSTFRISAFSFFLTTLRAGQFAGPFGPGDLRVKTIKISMYFRATDQNIRP